MITSSDGMYLDSYPHLRPAIYLTDPSFFRNWYPSFQLEIILGCPSKKAEIAIKRRPRALAKAIAVWPTTVIPANLCRLVLSYCLTGSNLSLLQATTPGRFKLAYVARLGDTPGDCGAAINLLPSLS